MRGFEVGVIQLLGVLLCSNLYSFHETMRQGYLLTVFAKSLDMKLYGFCD